MKILVMGIPGSGKTFLSKDLQGELNCAWFNADIIRKMANDWDFSVEGRERQAFRMRSLADFEKKNGRLVICDFVCPTNKTREIFHPDFIVWMDTITKSDYEDTNKIFEKPMKFDFIVKSWAKNNHKLVAKEILRVV